MATPRLPASPINRPQFLRSCPSFPRNRPASTFPSPSTPPPPRVGSPYDDLSALDLLHGYVLLSAGRQFRGVSERYANALAQKVVGAGMTARKSDELSHSTQTSFGDEWVPNLWSAQVWQQARLSNVILPLFRAIEMPSNPFHLPVEGTDPTVYFVPETTGEGQTRAGCRCVGHSG